MIGARRRARMISLQALFEGDLVGHDPDAALDRGLEAESATDEVSAFARHLVHGVLAHTEMIDQEIAQAAPAWPVSQMPGVDKNVLRLAIFELLFDNRTVPAKAAINEAVEIAKLFGSSNTSRFVNGVLGTVASGRVHDA